MASVEHRHDGYATGIPLPMTALETCPTCDQVIPLERTAEVAGKLAARDRQRAVELTSQLGEQFARERTAAEATLQRTRAEHGEAMERARAEAAQHEAAIREQAHTEAASTLETRLTEQAQSFEGSIATIREQLATSEESRAQAAAALEAQRAEGARREATARDGALQEAAATLETRLVEQARGFEQTIGSIQEQLAAAAESRAQSEQRAAHSAAELVEVRALASQSEARLREQLTREFEQTLSSQESQLKDAHTEALKQSEERYAATVASQVQEASELRAKLADANNVAQEQVDAVRRDYKAREQAGATQLHEVTARLSTAEAERQVVREQLQSATQSHAAEISRAVQETREAMEKDKTTAVHVEQAKRLEETQKWSGKLEDLQRQLERKTAEELGEGAELDLYEELKARFEGDAIRRVPRGVAGADIIHEVRENGVVCGKIVYDSKNRKDWKYEYATKLRADQISERADHAVLSTNKFPAGTKQLHVHDHVIIACPARVLAVAEIMREQIVQFHTLRVSNEAREEKTQQLYEFMTSPRAAQLFDAVNAQITKLEEIDAAEVNAHKVVWDRRGKAVKTLEKAHGNLRFEVQRIVGALNPVVGP
jgi:hypothetical protein